MKRKRNLYPEMEAEGDEEEEIPVDHEFQMGSDGSIDSGFLENMEEEERARFRKGNILSVRIENFLTFDSSILHAGPMLNLVVGPNGSGKSSIVGAILLGLNGSLKLLGRSTKLESFIKHGKPQATVEILIYDEDARRSFRTVKRVFDRQPSSQWYLDGRRTTMGEVDQLREYYNIQLENLCVFLPQDRVSEFAQQTPHELLQSTLSAIGGKEMSSNLEFLKDEYKKFEEESRKGKSNAHTLEELKRKNQGLETDVQLVRERQSILDKVRVYKLYRPWLEYSIARDNAVELRESLDKAKSIASEKEQQWKEAHKPGEHSEVKLKEYEKDFKKCQQETKRVADTLGKVSSEIEAVEGSYHEARSDIKVQKEKAKARQNRLEKAKQELAQLKREKQAAPKLEAINDQLAELIEKRREQTEKIREIARQKHQLQQRITTADRTREKCQGRIQYLANAKRILLSKLNSYKRDGSNTPEKCFEWVQRNQQMFRGRVYGPLAVEMQIDNEYHARVVEASVPPWAMCAMVVETKDDRQILLRELKEKMGLQLDILSVPARTDLRFENPASISALRDFGLYTYADSVFKAPPSVKRAVLAQFPLHSMLIGESKASKHLDEIGQQGVKIFFTPESTYTVKKSRYGSKNQSTLITPLKQAKFFDSKNDDRGEVERLQAELDEALHMRDEAKKEIQALVVENGECSKKLASYGEQIETLKRKRTYIQRIDGRIKTTEEQIRMFEEEAGDQSEKKIGELREKASDLKTKLRSSIQIYLRELSYHEESLQKLSLLSAKNCEAVLDHKICLHGLESIREESEKAKEEVQRINSEYREAVKEMKSYKAKADKNAPRDEETAELFQTLPDQLDELDDLIVTENARANALISANEQVVHEYERRQEEIANLTANLEAAERTRESRIQDLENRRINFVGEVEEKVKRMSEKFSELYKRIFCAGDVQLKGADNLSEMYIEVLVSYRGGSDLVPLKATTQSGGEQMMATMIYIFALQQLTPDAAFRVIDEMNQGVDQRNERSLMEMMIEDATRGDAQQTFIITPKLLKGLPLNRNVVPHIILNGEVLGEEQMWNPADLIEGIKA